MKSLVTIACALAASSAAFADWSSADDNAANRTPFTGIAVRSDVEAALAQAQQSGDVYGAHGVPVYVLARHAFAPRPVPESKSVLQADMELAEAMRNGDMLAHDQSGLTYAQQYPSRFARAERRDDSQQLAGGAVPSSD